MDDVVCAVVVDGVRGTVSIGVVFDTDLFDVGVLILLNE